MKAKVVKRRIAPPHKPRTERPPLTDESSEAATLRSQDLIERIERLENEIDVLRTELWKQKRKPSGTIGYLLLSFGAIALISSTLYSSITLTFIGLGLTFWGALMLFIKPTRYMRASLLNPTAISTLTAVDEVIDELNYKGKGVYLPPRYVQKPEDGTVFIPSEKAVVIPPVEKASKEKGHLKDPDGVCLTPPGLSLVNLFEKELGADLSKVGLNYLKSKLPKLFTEGLEIAEEFEINQQNDSIHVKMVGCIYRDICNEVRKLPNIHSLGCPICSSIALALTRATGKPVIIETNNPSTDGKTTETYYRILEE